MPERIAICQRKTKETEITVRLNLDGTGKAEIQTGIGFFDHMLEALPDMGCLIWKSMCRGICRWIRIIR